MHAIPAHLGAVGGNDGACPGDEQGPSNASSSAGEARVVTAPPERPDPRSIFEGEERERRLRMFSRGTNAFVKGPLQGEVQSTLVATEGRRLRHTRVPCEVAELRHFGDQLAAGKFRSALPTVKDVGELSCSPKSASRGRVP